MKTNLITTKEEDILEIILAIMATTTTVEIGAEEVMQDLINLLEKLMWMLKCLPVQKMELGVLFPHLLMLILLVTNGCSKLKGIQMALLNGARLA